MSVAIQARSPASLLYETAVFNDSNRYWLRDGSKSATFRACPKKETQYNGGFVVAGAQCLRLDVSWRTSSGMRSTPVHLPFGTTKRCPPP